MCLIWHPCPNKRFALKTRWDQVLTLKFRSMFTVSCWLFFDRKIIDNMASNAQLTVLPFTPNMIKSNGSLVFCLKDQNWERKRERDRVVWEGGGGGGVRAREIKMRRNFWQVSDSTVYEHFVYDPFVGQGQILFFLFFQDTHNRLK